MDWWIGSRPSSGDVSQADLEGKVNQHGKSQVFLTEPLVYELEVGNGVVCLEADLRDEMDNDDALNIFELQDAQHALVYFDDPVALFSRVFALEHCEAERYC